jgi:hypothetical protein
MNTAASPGTKTGSNTPLETSGLEYWGYKDTTTRARKKRKRGYPAHLAQQQAQAERDEQRRITGPSFRCEKCGTYYKPTVMKHYKPGAFQHEQDVCRWCYKELTGQKSLVY